MNTSADWTVAAERPTLALDEIAVWRLPSEHPYPLETVLARYLGVDTGSLVLEPTPNGKPALSGSPHRFNLAHSAEVALVAITLEHDVGVDVERVRPDADRWALVEHALTARERRQLQRIPSTERAHAFLSVWARKEALLKAAGVGLSIEPVLIELERDSVLAVPPELGSVGDWTVRTIPLPGHVAAVAVRSEVSHLELYTFVAEGQSDGVSRCSSPLTGTASCNPSPAARTRSPGRRRTTP